MSSSDHGETTFLKRQCAFNIFCSCYKFTCIEHILTAECILQIQCIIIISRELHSITMSDLKINAIRFYKFLCESVMRLQSLSQVKSRFSRSRHFGTTKLSQTKLQARILGGGLWGTYPPGVSRAPKKKRGKKEEKKKNIWG